MIQITRLDRQTGFRIIDGPICRGFNQKPTRVTDVMITEIEETDGHVEIEVQARGRVVTSLGKIDRRYTTSEPIWPSSFPDSFVDELAKAYQKPWRKPNVALEEVASQ